MRIARIAPDEAARLSALDEYDALRSDVDLGLRDITDLAGSLFDVPIALVTLVGRTRQVFAGATGLPICGTERDVSFCSHALGSDDLLVVPDATLDPRFVDNPLVTGEPHIRFYAGAPLRGPAGHVLGTVCIIDRKPRGGLSAADRRNLRHLATLALDKLENRRLAVASREGQTRFRSIAATSPDAIVCADGDGRITFWNATAERLFGFSAAEAVGADLDLIVPDHMRGGHGGGLHRVAAGGTPRLVGKTVELDALHKDGHHFPIELSLSMWHEAGQASFGAIMRDLTERRRNEDRLFHLAHHDALTGLPNRGVLFRRLSDAVATADRVHLLLVDLDGFKRVNDTIGHRGGDALLKQVATRLGRCVQTATTLARLGGDEFALLVPAGDEEPAVVADCIIAALGSPFAVDGQVARVGASVGIATFPAHGTTPEELISHADLALYQAKREGRRCHRTFTEALHDEALTTRGLEEELRRALERGEFELFYQPQVSLADGRVTGAEALIRWQHPARGLLAPGAFLSVVERALLAVDVGTWVLETACAQAVAWRRQRPGFRMGVNLFEAQFGNGTLVSLVRSVLARTGLAAAGLELEVTENVILRHDATMLAALQALHAEGVGIAFDDFGTGFASLSMLRTFPLTRLKIDRSFVGGLGHNRVDTAIITAVAAMGYGIGLDVIAEGIETDDQHDLLRASGCTSGQGYAYARPMPAAAFEEWLNGRDAAADGRVQQ